MADKKYSELEKLAEGRMSVKVYDKEGNLKEEVKHERVKGSGAIEHRRKMKKGKGKKKGKKISPEDVKEEKWHQRKKK